MKKAIGALVGTGILLVSGLAAAQQPYGGGYSGTYQPAMPPPRSSGLDNLGAEGQVVIGVDRVMGLSIDSVKTTTKDATGKDVDVKDKSTTFALFGNAGGSQSALLPRLALDYFVVEGVSIGGSFVFISTSTSNEVDGTSTDGPTTTSFLFHPRVGYAMAFDETFSFWPRLGVTYANTKTTTKAVAPATDDTEEKWNGFNLTAEANIGISPFSNFAFLIGPFLEFPLSGTAEQCQGSCNSVDAKLTSFGITTSLVGYFGE